VDRDAFGVEANFCFEGLKTPKLTPGYITDFWWCTQQNEQVHTSICRWQCWWGKTIWL